MRVGEARGGEVYMRKERHLMATVKILGWPTRTDVVTFGGEVLATLQLQRDRRVTATTSALSNYLGDAEIIAM